MATLIHDCPHCGADNVAFNAVHAIADPRAKYYWSVMLVCPACGRGVVAWVSDTSYGANPLQHTVALNLANKDGVKFAIHDVQPRRAHGEIPLYLPPAVEKAFKEGGDILLASPNGAVFQFRRALELGLKDLSPEIEAWKLEKRIDKMAAEGLITKSIQEWAHKLRLDGNGAVHDEDVTADVAKEVQSLTRFVLTYLFTLPESVKAAQGGT